MGLQGGCFFFLLLVVVATVLLPWASAEGYNSTALRDKCKDEVDELSGCIAYATGKVEAPSTECCDNVKKLRDDSPACLCYVIQKANCGQQAVFSMVLLVDRLVGLPDACRLNGLNNVTLCPYLLELPAGSPDIAIFNGSDRSRKSVYCEVNSGFSSQFNSARGILFAAASAIVSSILSF